MSEYSVEDILKAKRVAREAGYDVSLPKDPVQQAMNIAAAHGYSVKKADAQPAPNAAPVAAPAPKVDIEAALKAVTDAGYSVRKNPNVPPAQPNAAPVNQPPQKPTPKQEVPAAPASAPAAPEHEPSWAEKIAAKYL